MRHFRLEHLDLDSSVSVKIMVLIKSNLVVGMFATLLVMSALMF